MTAVNKRPDTPRMLAGDIPIPEPEPELENAADAAPAADDEAPTAPDEAAAAQTSRVPIADRVVTTKQLHDLPPIDWHIEGLLPKSSLVVMYGPPGSYKSFLAVAMAMSLDTGIDFLGHSIKTPARPLYIVGEGLYGLGPRLRAWEQHWQPQSPSRTLWHNGAVNLYSYEQVAELTGYIGEHDIGFVVFDTLARCTVGVEENSAKEMGVVIANLDRIRDDTGATIQLVHHSGKDTGRGSRGSSAIKGAADAELSVVKGRLAVEKMKDGAQDDPTFFEILTVHGSVVPAVTRAPESGDVDEVSVAEDLARVIDFLDGEDEPRTKSVIHRNIGGNKTRVLGSIDTGVARGDLTEVAGPRNSKLIGLPSWT